MGIGMWDVGFGLSTAFKRPMMVHFRLVLLVASAILGAVSCRTADVPPVNVATREVRDDLGRTINLPEKIDRAISLAPSVTEMIFAVGAADKLVGVTTYCNYPAEAATIDKVGDTQTPNIERIIALQPQVVFVSTASQLEAFSRTLDEQGIAVYVTNPTKLDDVYMNLRQLGQILGEQDAAERVVGDLASRASAVRLLADHHDPNRIKRRVFVQFSKDPLFTIGKDSFLTELVSMAGGVSVTKDVPTAFPTLSKETAAALDPDVIFLSDSDDNREPNGAFRDSAAVRNGLVYNINADILSRPGPRLIDALEQMAVKLKGEE